MAKKIVKNLGNQPLYFNLSGGRSLKIPARSQAEVEEEDVNSGEMALHQSRGNIILVDAGEEKSEGGAGAGASHPPGGRVNPQPAVSAQKEEGGED